MTSRRVLVAHGSRPGATAGIAEEIGGSPPEDGLDVVVVSADTVTDVSGDDGVVLCGALYAGHWNGTARRGARRTAEQLRVRPVGLFGGDPMDSPAEQHDLPPVPGVDRQPRRLDAREQFELTTTR
ncbi:flavodoxin domain-containing protein [Streptomyces sp. NPDC006458]|uniref:flavodoxin domain-containing protein n=1 Tax=Streptomyces sp. NPDC006458 TaxID=3154302 RepID=UPI0033A2EAC6